MCTPVQDNGPVIDKIEETYFEVTEQSIQSQSKDSSARATSFHMFPELPVELQLKIWKYAVPGPRIFKLEPYNSKGQKQIRFRTMLTPPAMLQACKTSREVILETHTTAICSPASRKIIRFDGDIDTVVLHSPDPWYAPPNSDLQPVTIDTDSHEIIAPRGLAHIISSRCLMKIKNLALGRHWMCHSVDAERGWLWLIDQFGGLDHLTLLANSFGSLNVVADDLETYILQSLEDASAHFENLFIWLHIYDSTYDAFLLFNKLSKKYETEIQTGWPTQRKEVKVKALVDASAICSVGKR